MKTSRLGEPPDQATGDASPCGRDRRRARRLGEPVDDRAGALPRGRPPRGQEPGRVHRRASTPRTSPLGVVIALGPGEAIMAAVPHPGDHTRHLIELAAGGLAFCSRRGALAPARAGRPPRDANAEKVDRNALLLGAGIVRRRAADRDPLLRGRSPSSSARAGRPPRRSCCSPSSTSASSCPLLVILALRTLAGERVARLALPAPRPHRRAGSRRSRPHWSRWSGSRCRGRRDRPPAGLTLGRRSGDELAHRRRARDEDARPTSASGRARRTSGAPSSTAEPQCSRRKNGSSTIGRNVCTAVDDRDDGRRAHGAGTPSCCVIVADDPHREPGRPPRRPRSTSARGRSRRRRASWRRSSRRTPQPVATITSIPVSSRVPRTSERREACRRERRERRRAPRSAPAVHLGVRRRAPGDERDAADDRDGAARSRARPTLLVQDSRAEREHEQQPEREHRLDDDERRVVVGERLRRRRRAARAQPEQPERSAQEPREEREPQAERSRRHAGIERLERRCRR